MVGLGPKKPPSRKGTGTSHSNAFLVALLVSAPEINPLCWTPYAGL